MNGKIDTCNKILAKLCFKTTVYVLMKSQTCTGSEVRLDGLTVRLTSLCARTNSRGSPLAQGGRMTSPSATPLCLTPGDRQTHVHG